MKAQDSPKIKVVRARVELEFFQAVQEYARKHKITNSQLVREAVEQYNKNAK